MFLWGHPLQICILNGQSPPPKPGPYFCCLNPIAISKAVKTDSFYDMLQRFATPSRPMSGQERAPDRTDRKRRHKASRLGISGRRESCVDWRSYTDRQPERHGLVARMMAGSPAISLRQGVCAAGHLQLCRIAVGKEGKKRRARFRALRLQNQNVQRVRIGLTGSSGLRPMRGLRIRFERSGPWRRNKRPRPAAGRARMCRLRQPPRSRHSRHLRCKCS